jgi:hypothetical protein
VPEISGAIPRKLRHRVISSRACGLNVSVKLPPGGTPHNLYTRLTTSQWYASLILSGTGSVRKTRSPRRSLGA